MQKIHLFSFFLILLTNWACTNTTPQEAQEVDQKDATTAVTDNASPSQEAITPQTYTSLDEFWPAFQQELAADDVLALGPKVAFPLKGAQYLIGKAEQEEGITAEQFADNLKLLFDAEAREAIANTSFNQLEKVPLQLENFAINGLDPNGYRLAVQYNDEEGESTILYTFGKTPIGYKLIGLDFAG